MSIVDTPEKYVSNFDSKLDKIKVRISSMKSPSTLFSFPIRAMYNRVYCDQNRRLILKSYIPAINTSIFPKKHYKNIFSEKLINELHNWIVKITLM